MANNDGAHGPTDPNVRAGVVATKEGGVTAIYKGGLVASGNVSAPLPAAPASGSAVAPANTVATPTQASTAGTSQD